jgi:hypothetical protein
MSDYLYTVSNMGSNQLLVPDADPHKISTPVPAGTSKVMALTLSQYQGLIAMGSSVVTAIILASQPTYPAA